LYTMPRKAAATHHAKPAPSFACSDESNKISVKVAIIS
jgi:hypothetical protein